MIIVILKSGLKIRISKLMLRIVAKGWFKKFKNESKELIS